LNSIKFWVDKYFYDFDNLLVTRLIKFLSDEVSLSPKLRIFCKTLKRSLAQKLITDDAITAADYNFKEQAEEPVLPKNFNRDDKNFPFVLLHWDSRELAKQMTILESILFKSIEPKECLSGSWAKPNTKHLRAPNIVALTDRWNLVTEWVSTTVMSEPDIKKRKKLIQKFIDLANELRKLNNYNGVTEIIAGLQSVAVHRLKKTWASLPETSIELFKTLAELIDAQGAYKAMRDELKQSTPPCIPPMAMYLKDLIFIEDGNPDELKSPNGVQLVNFFKRRKVSEVILKMREYQLSPYNFSQLPYLRDQFNQKLFEEGKLLDDEAMWKNSLKFEPREAK
jgi:son of sevenless